MPLTMSDLVHPTAVVDPEAEIAPDVQIGPYAILEGAVRLGPGCVVESHACLTGPLCMGHDNFVGHGAVLGKSPQHRGYRGETTFLRIGDSNVFREHVTVHRGTLQGGGETRIGNNNMFMIGSHVGHDACVGDGCTLINGALVAGHVTLHDNCILSGHSAIQQRVRVGRLAMVGGLGSSTKDIPPFVLHQGYNSVTSLNIIGLRRAGFSQETIAALRESFRIFYKEGRTKSSALERIEADFSAIPEVLEFVNFIRESTLGINPLRGADRKNRTF
ncbi:acyl-ACP--UDP-N-acetylglucosamine O-acyltransferase [Singulisphaera sp. PoT]|uniref:acyl-ACP--UDP-N-acetylglucosamine O-acyltransferase n=1 Tax=Singulisphaera sp. PoT TaxID=3411797 RepID=UPI003BF46BFE